jgi:hypothetical protein
MHISITGLSCATIITENADSRINRKIIDFFIGGNFNSLPKLMDVHIEIKKKLKG